MIYLYNSLLILWALIMSPKVLFDRIIHKKYRGSLLFRLGLKRLNFPKKQSGAYRIWIHAVSLGESKAVFELVYKLKKEKESIEFYFSTATETGQNEVKQKLSFATVFYLPLDFSWTMKKLIKEISPDLFILVETDYWMNLLNQLKENSTKIALVNGKLSPKSYKRFKFFRFVAKKFFSPIDCFCLQTKEDYERFISLGVDKTKLSVVGNLKFDTKIEELKQDNLIFPKGINLLLASTHEKEEKMLLDQLKAIQNHLNFNILIAPRHPERFEKVEKLLISRGEKFRKIEDPSNNDANIVLINKMGLMDACYKNSDLVIMGGSFIKNVGGHNVYEPLMHEKEVVFGPYMHKQKELVSALKKHDLGYQIKLNELKYKLETILKTPANPLQIRLLKNEFQGSSDRSLKIIKEYLVKN